MIVDGEKFEISIPKQTRHSRSTQATIKINEERKDEQQLRQEQEETIKETIVTKYEDGVYSIFSRKYGVEVLADGERMKVKTHHLIFRNKATGLCGDLNGEKTGDLTTGRQCHLSESELAGYSFMLEDGKCRGIPQEEKTQIRQEEQRCVREEVKPTRVSELFGKRVGQQIQHSHSEKMHLIEERSNKLCFSKEMVRVCENSFPSEVRARQAEFVCMTGPESKVMERRVLAGDRCEELNRMPTQFSQTVYEPTRC